MLLASFLLLLTSFLPFLSKPWSCNFTSLYTVVMLVRKFGERYKNRKVDKAKEGDIVRVNSTV